MITLYLITQESHFREPNVTFREQTIPAYSRRHNNRIISRLLCSMRSFRQHKRYVEFGHHKFIITWKHFPRYWPFVRGIHRSPVNSPHKGQWRRALMFSLICVWTYPWLNNRDASDLRRHRAHFDVIVMLTDSRATYHPLNDRLWWSWDEIEHDSVL